SVFAIIYVIPRLTQDKGLVLKSATLSAYIFQPTPSHVGNKPSRTSLQHMVQQFVVLTE
ncbi:hypothetical protein LCGC14_2812300, partial [marine sediment metagenome]